ncbi:MAG: endolytic transglycosylase MltG [Gammaproteobacteria bacterium]|nr:endolytic transglycosylase MltG [Gammaproteobacteria bacterium]
MNKRVLLVPATVIVAGVAVLASVNVFLGRWASQPLPLASDTVFIVPAGATLGTVADSLGVSGVVDPTWFSLRARHRNLASSLRRGEYAVGPGETADELLDRLVSGDVVQHRFRITEGTTAAEAIAALAADERVDFDLGGATTTDLMTRLGLEGNAEGAFFPDTYLFERDDTASELLRRAHLRMQQILTAAWAQRDPRVAYEDQRQALILASIIEKETGLDADRPRIASVFLNRLSSNMRLQSDPTVIYGLGSAFDGDLKRVHLATDHPYNTYRHRGLPPTPISLPGRASIEAALHPSGDDDLYFVARGDGSSEFSADLEQHNAAVRRYQLRQTL